MKVSRGKFGMALGVLALAAAGLGLRSANVSAAPMYNLVPSPGSDGTGMGFISVGGAGVQIDASGLTPNTDFRVNSCTSTGSVYNCSFDVSGGIVRSTALGQIHTSVAAGQAPGTLDAYIMGALNDNNNQYIARVSGNPAPTAYTQPAASPFVPFAVPLVTPLAGPTFVTANNCANFPFFAFVANCAFLPGFGFGLFTNAFIGVVPGFTLNTVPGFGFFFTPLFFNNLLLNNQVGTVVVPVGTPLTAFGVCPAGFHGFLTVGVGSVGFPFFQFIGNPFLLPLGTATTTIFCP